MSINPVITLDNVSKCYPIYAKPRDRLLQMFYGNRKQLFNEFWAIKTLALL